MLLGIAGGLVIGILPGLGGVVGMSLYLPFLFGMDPYVGLGMLVFANSEFVPISRFGCLMSASLLSAIFGDLLLLPALIVSPLGRVFGKKR